MFSFYIPSLLFQVSRGMSYAENWDKKDEPGKLQKANKDWYVTNN